MSWLVTSKEHQGPARLSGFMYRSPAKWPVGNFVTLSLYPWVCESSAFIRTDKTSQIFACWRSRADGRTRACDSCSAVVCSGNVAAREPRGTTIDSKVTATAAPTRKKAEEQEVLIFSTIAPHTHTAGRAIHLSAHAAPPGWHLLYRAAHNAAFRSFPRYIYEFHRRRRLGKLLASRKCVRALTKRRRCRLGRIGKKSKPRPPWQSAAAAAATAPRRKVQWNIDAVWFILRIAHPRQHPHVNSQQPRACDKLPPAAWCYANLTPICHCQSDVAFP